MNIEGNCEKQLERLAWFCLRSQPKHEHIAAAHLRQEGIEAFSPRIRFQKKTQRGVQWFTESLFPNYLFARFAWQNDFRKVQHVRGVGGIIHFGDKFPTIAENEIAELRLTFGETELHTIEGNLETGSPVDIATGAFQGLSAVITRIMPNQERVEVLLEFLGRQTSVEIDASALLDKASPRAGVVGRK